MQDLTGKNIDRYHIIEKLGHGGMAVVYKAFDTRLERDVAMKFIRVEAFSPELLESMLLRFEKEGKALARFSHGNIVQVFDYGEYEGAPYLVMEYLPGGTLKTRFQGKINWQQAAGLLAPLARGLAYAHHENVVHRDVKPANILFSKSGEPKLADFGIARILEGDNGETLTGTGMGIGTPEYMAPEQAQGMKPDGRADVYALGLVFYEMITGTKPFTADTPLAVILKQVHDPLPAPGQFVKNLPDEVEHILYKSLAKSPDNRYETMDAFAGALEKLKYFGTANFPEKQFAESSTTPTEIQNAETTVDLLDLGTKTESEDIGDKKFSEAETMVQNDTDEVLKPKTKRKWILPVAAAALITVFSAIWFLSGFLKQPDAPNAMDELAIETTKFVMEESDIPHNAVNEIQTQSTKFVMQDDPQQEETAVPEEQDEIVNFNEEAQILLMAVTESDISYSEKAIQGLQKAASDFELETAVLECNFNYGECEQVLRDSLDRGNHLLYIFPDFQFAALMEELPAQYPDTKFVCFNSWSDHPNLMNVYYSFQEPNYLLGAAAGMLTEQNHINLIMPYDYPFIHRFAEPFIAGAEYTNPLVKTDVYFTGSFEEAPARDYVRYLLENDLAGDVIHVVTGAGNVAVYEEIQNENILTTGTETELCDQSPGQMIDHIVSREDRVVYSIISEYVEGHFENGNQDFGFKDQALGLSVLENPGTELDCVLNDHPEIIEKLQEILSMIESGQIVVEDPMYE